MVSPIKTMLTQIEEIGQFCKEQEHVLSYEMLCEEIQKKLHTVNEWASHEKMTLRFELDHILKKYYAGWKEPLIEVARETTELAAPMQEQVDGSIERYPLPLQKSQINWNLEYMKKGGKQLIEILENDIPLTAILSNPRRYDINDGQVRKLDLWIKYNTIVEHVKNELGLRTSYSVRTSLFLEGGGVLGKLMNYISSYPLIDELGNVTSRYSFLSYQPSRVVNENGEFLVVRSQMVDGNWNREMKDEYKRRFNTHLFLKRTEFGWVYYNPTEREKGEWIQN